MKIENGCSRLMGEENSWLYTYTDVRGIHNIVFIAFQKPEIGDFIINGLLVPKTEPQINPDTSKWEKHYRKVWGK
jgi:hypothetical protein